MRKLIIHAGIHRTGTTGIQRFLAENRAKVERLGYRYPGPEKNHQRWAWGILKGNISPHDFRDYLFGQPTSTVIVSAEDFCIHTNLDWIDALSNDFEIIAHISLRRQDDWVMSWYNQHVRWPFDRSKYQMTPDEFLRTIDDYHWLHYDRLIKRWSAKIGRENVRVSVMGKAQVTAFVSSFIPELVLDEEPTSKNQSISFAALDLIRRVDIFDMKPLQRIRIAEIARGIHNENIKAVIYSPEQRRAIMEKFEDGNRRTADLLGLDHLFQPPSVDEAFVKFDSADSDRRLISAFPTIVSQLFARQ